MVIDFCTGCDSIQYPQCAIFKIINTASLKALLDGKDLETNPYLVCHQNALKIESGKMISLSKCDNCMLCKIACNKISSCTIEIGDIEKSILNDLGRLNIYASSLNPNSLVATEVKADGNYRQKRIDLVIKKNTSVVFIKVLQNIEKYKFYYRSYEEIAISYKQLYPKVDFYCKTLVPSYKKERANQLGNEVILVKDIAAIL